MKAQILQAQKMEALGMLAGGIAHDFNNILAIILGYTELAYMDTPEGSPARPALQEVLKATQRGRELVQQILAFSRRGEQDKIPVQVGPVIKGALRMLRASLPTTIDIKADVTSKGVVLAEPNQIYQVVINLCSNAAHAMRENGGTLGVGLSDVVVGPEAALPRLDLQPGSYVKLTVEDTGHGIPAETIDHIFDPFFTTKGPGVGTGLGLAVVHNIVKCHGGVIGVQSYPGRGTAFQVLFPVINGEPAVDATEHTHPPHGRERILFVEDEPSLAGAMKKMLEQLGYEVDCRVNGMEALEVFCLQSEKRPYDLVITDMTMPHLTGADLAGKLLELQPGLPVVLCTGFSELINEERFRSIGIQDFLTKPVCMTELAATIRKVLNKSL